MSVTLYLYNILHFTKHNPMKVYEKTISKKPNK